MSFQEFFSAEEIPAYVQAEFKDGMPCNQAAGILWAGKLAPPEIGALIYVSINSCGPARVIGYFVQDGYLGVINELLDPPEWFVKQNGAGNNKGHSFGPEFEPVFEFSDSGEAYNACQCRDELSGSGQLLHIPEQKVVGLSWAWPVAASEECADLHMVAPGQDPAMLKDDKPPFSRAQCKRAARLAKVLGYGVNPEFQPYA